MNMSYVVILKKYLKKSSTARVQTLNDKRLHFDKAKIGYESPPQSLTPGHESMLHDDCPNSNETLVV